MKIKFEFVIHRKCAVCGEFGHKKDMAWEYRNQEASLEWFHRKCHIKEFPEFHCKKCGGDIRDPFVRAKNGME